jgi:hypothetical protein
MKPDGRYALSFRLIYDADEGYGVPSSSATVRKEKSRDFGV